MKMFALFVLLVPFLAGAVLEKPGEGFKDFSVSAASAIKINLTAAGQDLTLCSDSGDVDYTLWAYKSGAWSRVWPVDPAGASAALADTSYTALEGECKDLTTMTRASVLVIRNFGSSTATGRVWWNLAK